MPKRDDIKSVMVIGSGPIIIGQACEFDYSGTQACRVLMAEGIRVVLVNSNPATIMTDPEFADATYIEPITPEFVEKVIEKERPDALLATLGGQTALNTAMALDAVLLQHARRVQGHRGVERGLAAQRREQRVRALLLDHLLHELRRDRLDVGGVGEVRIGHDGRRVRVRQDDPVALLAQDAARLGARVVELAGLADDDRPGADHHDALQVGALRHGASAPRSGRKGRQRRAGRRRPPGGTGR